MGIQQFFSRRYPLIKWAIISHTAAEMISSSNALIPSVAINGQFLNTRAYIAPDVDGWASKIVTRIFAQRLNDCENKLLGLLS